MKRRNGFTLIELLAVIVILALIAVIASPLIINVIENARKESAANSAYGALNGVKSHYADSLLSTNPISLPFTVDFGAEADTETGVVAGKNVAMSGNKPTEGTVTLTSSGKYCVGTYVAAAGETPESCTEADIEVNSYNCSYDWETQKVTGCTKAS